MAASIHQNFVVEVNRCRIAGVASAADEIAFGDAFAAFQTRGVGGKMRIACLYAATMADHDCLSITAHSLDSFNNAVAARENRRRASRIKIEAVMKRPGAAAARPEA